MTESTLTFNPDERFNDYEPYELVAEGIHERGERSVRVTYVLDTEVDGEPTLNTKRYFRIDGERVNEGLTNMWDLTKADGDYTVDHNGQRLEQFIRDAFYLDPDVEVGEQFDSVIA